MAKYTTADLDAVRREREAKGTYTGKRLESRPRETEESIRARLIGSQLRGSHVHSGLQDIFGGLAGGHVHTHTLSPLNSLGGAGLTFGQALRARGASIQAQREVFNKFWEGRCPKCARVHDMDAICEKGET